MLHLPGEQPLVVGRGRPAGKDAERAAAGTRGTAAHRHHAVDAERHREIDRRAEARLRIAALARIRVQQVAGGVDRGEPDAMLPQLPL